MPLQVESHVSARTSCHEVGSAGLATAILLLPGKVHAAVGRPGMFTACPASISADDAPILGCLMRLGRPRRHASVVPYVIVCRVLRSMYSYWLLYLQYTLQGWQLTSKDVHACKETCYYEHTCFRAILAPSFVVRAMVMFFSSCAAAGQFAHGQSLTRMHLSGCIKCVLAL
jgi:hypothetical protein